MKRATWTYTDKQIISNEIISMCRELKKQPLDLYKQPYKEELISKLTIKLNKSKTSINQKLATIFSIQTDSYWANRRGSQMCNHIKWRSSVREKVTHYGGFNWGGK